MPSETPEVFAPGHFWVLRETPYEYTIRCECGWGWQWSQPWGGRGMALASYYCHTREAAQWQPPHLIQGDRL